jgi:leucyl-tRNA synthetase
MMELSNALQHASGPSRDDGVATLILLLTPFAPHITEELWQRRGGTNSVHQQSWPDYDARLAAAREVTLVVQVDGKVRDRITAPAGMSQRDAEQVALASAKVQAILKGAVPKKVIVVPDRLVSIVTS